jgi:serine/threonine protein phosphatase PrpC
MVPPFSAKDEEIRGIVRTRGANLQHTCDALVELAKVRGGCEDSTVVALRYSLFSH